MIATLLLIPFTHEINPVLLWLLIKEAQDIESNRRKNFPKTPL